MKYTRAVLEIPVRESKSYAEVLRRLGVKWNGGTQANVKKRIQLHGLDTSHFLGQANNQGPNHRGGPERLQWQEVLVMERRTADKKEATFRLRRAMIEAGIPHACAKCGQGPVWLGEQLTLQIDHVNGDNLDNRPHNVRFLCPNCHSQTETYGVKNAGRMF